MTGGTEKKSNKKPERSLLYLLLKNLSFKENVLRNGRKKLLVDLIDLYKAGNLNKKPGSCKS